MEIKIHCTDSCVLLTCKSLSQMSEEIGLDQFLKKWRRGKKQNDVDLSSISTD